MIPIAETKLTHEEVEAAVKVLESGALRQGKECDTFEQAFAAQTGARHAVSCSNGSAALHLAYAAVLDPGDEILVPSFTFFATASMAVQAGLKPVLCDVAPKTFLLDLADAERRLTPRTRAIAPVHLFGNPCDPDAIGAFARRHGLRIVWDAAQSHGAAFGGRDVGSFSDLVCYSFYPSKNLFVGEGGMVCTKDVKLDERMRALRSHGQTGKYYHTMLGWNYRMTDVEAAIGRAQLGRLDAMLARRRRNAEILTAGLATIKGLRLQQVTPKGTHAWHQFCIIVEPEFGMSRDMLAGALKRAGIATGVHYPRGVHQQPAMIELAGEQSLPVTEKLCERILALPVHHGLEDADVEKIVHAVEEAASVFA